jgi:predicted AAA+ superfamily ATPase
MIHHTIQALLDEGVFPKSICYFSVDSPIYNTLSIDKFLYFYSKATGVNPATTQLYFFFDEIQYLKDWETHLKSLVDTHTNIKAVASGSAAAALKLKSDESGAGRFTDFLLPPLTFYEYLELLDEGKCVHHPDKGFFTTDDIDLLNQRFIYYLNFGGYPEVIFSPQIQADPARFIKSDIIDKVLLRDLPSLYGISDIQELNYLFTTLAFNTANEVSLEELSKNSGVAKNTIKRYIEYLQAAFLIQVIHRVDRNSKRFRRANYFKVYLTNPSMRAALFSPITEDDKALPYLAETAIFSQWFHSDSTLHYARWKDGEVDIVMLSQAEQKLMWAVEVKWSDRYCQHPGELESLIGYCVDNLLEKATVTSKTLTVSCEIKGLKLEFIPASIYCYTVGYNLVRHKTHPSGPSNVTSDR